MPSFVNWNDYKATFEAEAEKIVGRPVKVVGSASATLLPSPSLTFEQVSVGEVGGEAMMTIDRFDVTIELMPLLQGEFRITAMRLDRPHLRILVAEDGTLDWQRRNEASQSLDPEKVILEHLEIADGHVVYNDPIGETALSFEGVNATVEARSLLGPWRIEGSYLEEGVAVPFRIATGRRLDDGTIRVKTDLSPAGWPVAVTADGVLGSGDDGLHYDGTYAITEIVPVSVPSGDAAAQLDGDTTGWRSEGTFRLTRQQLAITQAVLSAGPLERPYSVAGSLTVSLGAKLHFEAHASARQINLDRSLGDGPAKPVEVAVATRNLVASLVDSFVPPIPGRVFVTVPAIVVGGAVIQNVALEAHPTIGGWRLTSFNADLPGRATVEARGVLATDFEVGFAGDVRLVVEQPALFATWWRGKSLDGAGRLLAPLEISGRAELSPQEYVFEDIDAFLGDAAITGGFSWSESAARQHRRILATDLSADRVDFTQLHALAELVAGDDLTNTGILADSYDIKLAADAFQFEDVAVRDLAIDASFADDALTVNQLSVGDLGGASLHVTEGRIESLGEQPSGYLDAQLEAATLAGLTRVVERIMPDHLFTHWLRRAQSSLTPAFLTASVEAPPHEGDADLRVSLSGVAASTTLSAAFDLTGGYNNWRQGTANAEIVVDSPNSAELGRQMGVSIAQNDNPGRAHLEIDARGVPDDGLEASFAGEFAGVGFRSTGQLIFAADAPPTYAGSLASASDNLEPFLRLVGLDLPVAATGNAARVDGEIAIVGRTAELKLGNSPIADRFVAGRLSLAKDVDDSWVVGGDLHVDAVDLGWLTALGLGFVPEPSGNSSASWPRTPFGEPNYDQASGRIRVSADQLTLTGDFDASAASMSIELQPGRLSVDLLKAQVAGGTLGGGLSINNVDGNVRLTGRLDLKQAALDSLVWSRGGRAVATGLIDLSAEFEAAGRSPAALTSSLTGGGAVAIHDGQARYMNPQAARLVIRASDLGQEFTENELRNAFTEQIDGGTFAFDKAEGAFAIAAGVVRLKSLVVGGTEMRATGDAVIDLNELSIDSDWTVTFDPGDDRVEGTAPQVGLVFRGPLSGPERIIDVLQFGSYLNIRREERLLELLNEAEADRLEAERLNRERRKYREDAERRRRKAAEAEAARIAAEAEQRRALAEGAARQAAEEAARIAAEAESRRVAAEVAARQLVEAQKARDAAADEARRLTVEVERLGQLVNEASEKADKAEATLLAANDAHQRAKEIEAERAMAAAEAEGNAAEVERRRVAAEAAARAAVAKRETLRSAAADAVAAHAEAQRRRLLAEDAVRSAREDLTSSTAADERAKASAADARHQQSETVAARQAVADELAALAAAESALQQAADEASLAAERAEQERSNALAAVETAQAEVVRLRAAKKQADQSAADAIRSLLVVDQAISQTPADAVDNRAAALANAGETLRAKVDDTRRAAEEARQALVEAEAAHANAETEVARVAAEAERLGLATQAAKQKATDAAAAVRASEEKLRIAEANAGAAKRAAEEAGRLTDEATARRLAAEAEVAALAAEVERLTKIAEDAAGSVTGAEASAAAAETEATDLAAEAERLARAADAARKEAADAKARHVSAVEGTAKLASAADDDRQAAAAAANAVAEAEAAYQAAEAAAAAQAAEAERLARAAEDAARTAREATASQTAAEDEAARLAARAEQQKLVAEEATRRAEEVAVPR